MPTYEYRCPKGHEFELFQRMSDDPIATCPTCGAESERLLSAGAGFLFKGEGFYITDYRPDSYHEAAKAERAGADGKESPKDKSTKAESTSDSKSDKGTSATGSETTAGKSPSDASKSGGKESSPTKGRQGKSPGGPD